MPKEKSEDVNPRTDNAMADTKGEIRRRKSKDRQYYNQKKKDKKTKNDIQNATQQRFDQSY